MRQHKLTPQFTPRPTLSPQHYYLQCRQMQARLACSAERKTPQKEDPYVEEQRDIFWLVGTSLWRVVRHLKVHLVQQDIFSVLYKNSEFRTPYLRSSNSIKTLSCNNEFIVIFFLLFMSKMCVRPPCTCLLKKVQWGLNWF